MLSDTGNRLWRPLILMAAAALFLQGCWLFGGAPSGMPEKTFGVYNAFPAHPFYLNITHRICPGDGGGIIDSLRLKPNLTRAAIRFLEAKGYRAMAVDHPSVLADGAVDILIELHPLPVGRIAGAAGYGFLDGKMGQGTSSAASFMALQVSMRRRFSSRVIIPRPQERFSLLERDYPKDWDGLSPEEKAAFERNLTDNMAKAVYLSLSRLKI